MSTYEEPSPDGSAAGWDVAVLRQLEAEMYGDAGQARRLRRYIGALAVDTCETPPPTWWQWLGCVLMLIADAALLSAAVTLDSAPILTVALLLFIGSATPFFIKPRWQRRPASARRRSSWHWLRLGHGPR